jgi:thiamine kinase-like enzyme
MGQADPKGLMDKYAECLKKGAGLDCYGSQENRDMIDLFCANPVSMRKALYEKLSSRPKTLVHGDLRLENLFSSKENSLDFKIIDW